MTDAGRRVLAGFARLDYTERDEVYQKIKEYVEASYEQKRSLREGYEKAAGVVSGPVSTGCPCCGR